MLISCVPLTSREHIQRINTPALYVQHIHINRRLSSRVHCVSLALTCDHGDICTDRAKPNSIYPISRWFKSHRVSLEINSYFMTFQAKCLVISLSFDLDLTFNAVMFSKSSGMFPKSARLFFLIILLFILLFI